MRLRVATLNVWALPEPIARDVDARVDAIGRELGRLRLDVVAFQEVWSRDAADRLRRAGERAGLRHAWFGEGAFGRGGLFVLSRLPIESVEFEAFAVTGALEQVAANLEYLSGKGFATIEIRTPSGPLLLVNTHLHARYSKTASHRHLPQRTAQLAQMATHLAQRPEPFVAFGDFNFREDETDYRVMTEIIRARDVAAALDRRQHTTLRSNPYRSADSHDRRKDYIFVRDGSRGGFSLRSIERHFDERFQIEGRDATFSNHAGLVAELELGPREASVASGASGASAAPAAQRDREVFEAATLALAEGERLALDRRQDSRLMAGIGVGVAGAAALAASPPRISRRRLLRAGLGGLAVAALAPAVGFGLASEWAAPAEAQAFQRAAAQLAALDPQRGRAALASRPAR